MYSEVLTEKVNRPETTDRCLFWAEQISRLQFDVAYLRAHDNELTSPSTEPAYRTDILFHNLRADWTCNISG
jgi:hypothetical protein